MNVETKSFQSMVQRLARRRLARIDARLVELVKDVDVHTCFRWALRDALDLRPRFAGGTLALGRHAPPWLARGNGLAGYLAFSLFANAIRLDRVGAGLTEAAAASSER